MAAGKASSSPLWGSPSPGHASDLAPTPHHKGCSDPRHCWKVPVATEPPLKRAPSSQRQGCSAAGHRGGREITEELKKWRLC